VREIPEAFPDNDRQRMVRVRQPLITSANEWFDQNGAPPGNYWGTEKPQEGYVYVLEDRGVYKIGSARDPDDRLRCLGIKFPYPFKEIARIYTVDRYGAERLLHREFADKRVGGEWFELDEVDVWLIEALSEEVEDRDQLGLSADLPELDEDDIYEWIELEDGRVYRKDLGHPEERYPTITYFDWQ
jgi:Meiotically up-regulated gene 113